MRRIHLFEFEDQTWFPSFLRNYITDFLQFLSNKAKVYQPVVDVIYNTLNAGHTSTIIDLGSGSGGGLLWLSDELKKINPALQIILTDLFPNIEAFEYTRQKSSVFDYFRHPVDAKNVPESLKGLRTQFLSFHHFNPDEARMIIQNAVNAQQSIAIFEIQDRSFPSFIAMLLSLVSVLFTTPFIRPFRFGRLVFTYLIPVIPLVVLWDGIVSCLRTYSVDEMKALVDSLENKKNYSWQFDKKKSKTGFVMYMIGIPG